MEKVEATSRARCEAIVTLTTSRERQALVPQDKFTQQHGNAANVDQSHGNGLLKIATAKICVGETKDLVRLQVRARTIFQPTHKGWSQNCNKIPSRYRI